MLKQIFGYVRHNPSIVIVIIFAVILGYNTVNVIMRNYTLQQRVDRLNDDIAVLELENEQLRYNIEYYRTDAFLEKRARESLNLRAPGEEVVIVPKRPVEASEQAAQAGEEPTTQWDQMQQNMQDWVDVFSGQARTRRSS